MTLKVYGSRGSAAVAQKTKYGGNTTCMVLEHENNMLILDGGSGIINLDTEMRERFAGWPTDVPFSVDILVSHLHVDHIIGLPFFSPMWRPGCDIRLHTKNRGENPLTEQIFGAFVPPYWPISLSAICQAKCLPIDGEFTIGGLTITPFEGLHPDETLHFHITNGKETMVYLIDSEIYADNIPQYVQDKCQGADLVVFDVSYMEASLSQKKGWGHSSVEQGIKFAEVCNCKQVLFSHYGHEYKDYELDSLRKAAFAHYGDKFIFAREGLVINLGNQKISYKLQRFSK